MRLNHKACFVIVGAIIIFFLETKQSLAAMVVIQNDGKIRWNVLASEDQKPESLSIVGLPPNIAPTPGATVSLKNENGKLQLQVSSDKGNSNADVSTYTDDIIELEQKEATKHIKISSDGGGFLLKQNGVTAKTTFPITINSQDKELSVMTPTGQRFVQVLPYEAFRDSINASLIDNLLPETTLALIEGDQGQLLYTINGQKNIQLFNLLDIKAPVTLSVSAVNGEIIHVEKPVWLKVFGFLLEKT
jgi:hypothetical protein